MIQTNQLAAAFLGVGAAAFVGIFLAIVAAGTVAFLYIRQKVRGFSKTLFGTSDVGRVVNELKQQEWEYEETPKSVSGMTALLEPQIKRSYVDFQWLDFKKQVEETFVHAIDAWKTGDLSVIENITPHMRENLLERIEKDAEQGMQLHVDNLRIHQTEMANFRHEKGKDVICTQTAVECLWYKTKGGEVCEGSKEKKLQTRFDMEFIFVIDANAPEFTDLEITECPNCGAPVTKVGMICEFCGSPVKPKSTKRWVLNQLKQIGRE